MRLAIPRIARLAGFEIEDAWGGRFTRIEIQFRVDLVQIPDLRKRREFLEAGEIEVVEKRPGRRVQRGAARHIAVPHDPDPFAFEQ